VRRDKAALFQRVQAPPGDRSSRKQPEQAWRCVFRSIAITDFSGRRSSNPVEGDHGFRSKAITHSSDRDQHGMTG
jgi:hypothetical protein